jgi:hypothetical protein
MRGGRLEMRSTVGAALGAAMLLGTLAVPVAASADVDLCHKPDTRAEMTIAVDEAAVAGHLGHGDYRGTCGGRVLAIAYSDIDGEAGFGPNDVLIAKLVDANGDEVPSVGDVVRMGRFPLNRAATSFGDWGVRSHEVTEVLYYYADSTAVKSSDTHVHMWKHGAGADVWFEQVRVSGGQSSSCADLYPESAADEGIKTESASPSRPSIEVDDWGDSPGDDGFCDVELYY